MSHMERITDHLSANISYLRNLARKLDYYYRHQVGCLPQDDLKAFAETVVRLDYLVLILEECQKEDDSDFLKNPELGQAFDVIVRTTHDLTEGNHRNISVLIASDVGTTCEQLVHRYYQPVYKRSLWQAIFG